MIRPLSVLRLVTLLAASVTMGVGPLNTLQVTHAAQIVIFSDGFENGNSWTPYSNGSNPTQALVNNPVHSGASALQMTAGPAPDQPEVGLADIKSFTFTEDQSQLSFWYDATGSAIYKNLTIEAYTPSGQHFYTILPSAVVTGQWTQAQVMFTDLGLPAGTAISQFVIKAVITPDSGTGIFTIDDVTITNGVVPPPHIVVTSPPAGATDVPIGRVLTAFADEDLDPATVSPATVQLVDATGAAVPATVRYEAGQKAIALIPHGDLAPRTVYTLRIGAVTSAAGAPLAGATNWSFTTGAAGATTETVFSDDFAGNDGWTAYSNAGGGFNQQLVTSPTHGTAQALAVSANDPNQAFALSDIHSFNWLDEDSSIAFWYDVTGSAQPQDLEIMVTTAGGQLLYKPFLQGAVPANTWSYFRVRLADIAPGLVGQVVKTVEIKEETATPGTAQFVIDQVRIGSDLGQYAVLPPTTPSEPHQPLDPTTRNWVNALAQQALASQQPDGSIVVGPVQSGDRDRVVAYFSNYAVLGLLRAYQVTHQQRYLDASTAWLQWYQSHMNPDGTVDDYTGTYPNYMDSHDYDSADSYASTYMLDVWKYATLQHGAPQQQRYLSGAYPYVQKAYQALDSVYQADGLTIAKQSYPVRFVEDNSETWLGLVANTKLAALAGDAPQAKLSAYLAMRTLYAVRNRFWRPQYNDYANAVFTDGSVDPSGPLQTWYPDALSNVLPLAIVGGMAGRQPPQGDRALFDQLVTQFDVNDQADRPTAIDDTLQYTWWAMAALQVGEPQTAARFVREYVSIEGQHNPATLASTAGQLIRILSYGWDQSLWF